MTVQVSVIIPALNEAANIAHAMDRAWQAGADQVIVVDGGSTDGTPEIARQQRGEVLHSEPGRAVQQNAGARYAQGDVLLFLHADTWLAENGVAQIRTALADSRRWGGSFRQRIEHPGWRFRWLEWGNALRVRFQGMPYGDQGIFLRSEVFQATGGFPEVRLMEDVMLMRSLRRQAWPLLLEGPLYVSPRRWLREGVVRQTLRNWTLLTAYNLGVSPNRLARFYCRHDRG
jgi:rSAM/selenodomain-associated transferase 2